MENRVFFDCLKGVALFAMLGPPLGGLMFYVFGSAWSMLTGNYVGGNLLAGAPLFIMYSYFAGFIPALVVGAVAGLCRGRLDSTWRRVAFGAFSGLTGVALSDLGTTPAVFAKWELLFVVGLLCMASGALLAAVFGYRTAAASGGHVNHP